MSDETLARLESVAREVFDIDDLELQRTTVAADVPGWDSLGHVTFMYSMEQEFGVTFDDDEFAGFADVGDLERLLDAKQRSG
jgi:acyl carrier protein